MATVNKGKTFISGETVEPSDLHQLVDSATVTEIVDADVSASAAIALSKLATGALPTAITVASANIVDGTIVAADIASGAVTGPKLADGMVVQVVQASTTTVTTISSATASHEIPADNTKPQNTEGVEILTQAITPASSTNKVLVRAVVPFALEGSNTPVIALFRGSGADAIATSYISTVSAFNGMLVIEYLDSPETASSVTYRVRVGRGSAGTFYVNGASGGVARFNGTQFATLTLTEIKAS